MVYEAPRFDFGLDNGGGAARRPQVSLLVSAIRASDGEPVSSELPNSFRAAKITVIVDREAFEAASGEEIPVTGSVQEGTPEEVGGFAAAFDFGFSNRSVNGILTLTEAGTEERDLVEGTLELTIIETRGGFMEQMRNGAGGGRGR